MNIFVAQLSYQTKEDQLRSLFEAYGEVSSAKIIIDKFENRSKGFGFVEMASKSEGESAIDGLNGKEFKGRALNVNEARPRPESRGGRGGQGGGRGGQGGGRGGYGGGRGGKGGDR